MRAKPGWYTRVLRCLVTLSDQLVFQFAASSLFNDEELLVPRLFLPLAQLPIERLDVRAGDHLR